MRIVEKVSLRKRIDDAILQLKMRNKEVDYIELTQDELMELSKSMGCIYANCGEYGEIRYNGYNIKVVA